MTNQLIASGKTKRVLADADPRFVILEAIDRLTAGDAAQVAEIGTIGSEKTRQCARVFAALERNGIATAFVDQPAAIRLRCHAVDMLPLEFVMRRFAFGSYLKRNPDLQAQHRFEPPLCELFHKASVVIAPLVPKPEQISENQARELYLSESGWQDGVYTDPYIQIEGDDWLFYSAKAPVSGAPLMRTPAELDAAELDYIWTCLLQPAFTLLESKLATSDISLVDIKFEIGRRRDNGALVIADVIDNDSWRIWPGGDPKAQLDKQGFRDGDGVDAVLANYKIVTQLTEQF